MRMLILGGTVFLSRAIAEYAHRAGHDVTCVARGISGTVPAGVHHLRLDWDDPAAMATLRGETFDVVVDVARRPSQVRRFVELLGEGTGHWIFVSSISVYADTTVPDGGVGVTPLLPPLAADADETDVANYGSAKVSCEDAVRQAVPGRELIIRAGLIVGPGDPTDRFTYWPVRLARGGEILAPGDPADPVQIIDVRDLAAWIVAAAERGLRGTFDGVGPVISRGEVLERIADGIGVRPRLTWVEQDFLVKHEVQPWSGERSLPLWLPLPEYAGMMTRDWVPARHAGLTARDVAETARDTLAWHRQRPDDHRWLAGLTSQQEAELLAAWHRR